MDDWEYLNKQTEDYLLNWVFPGLLLPDEETEEKPKKKKNDSPSIISNDYSDSLPPVETKWWYTIDTPFYDWTEEARESFREDARRYLGEITSDDGFEEYSLLKYGRRRLYDF